MVTTVDDDFERFFHETYSRVVASLRLAVPAARASAEDAAQVAFTKALLRWGDGSTLKRPAAWVYVVAVRELRKRHKLDKQWRAPEDELGTGVSSDHSSAVATRAAVGDLIGALAPRQRLAVVLRFESDLTIEDVAKAMGCSVGAAKSTLHTALARMRVEVGRREEAIFR